MDRKRMSFREILTRHKSFVSNVAALMSGKAAAAAIAIVTMPIVARLFSPSDFGVAAVYLSIIGIVSNVASLRYEMALVLPEKDAEAVDLLSLAYRILIVVCVGITVGLIGYELSGLSWPTVELLGSWMWLLPFGIFLMAALQIQEHWLARKSSFKLVAASTVVGTVVNSTTRISCGIGWGSSIFGLIASNLLGMLSRIVLQRVASAEGISAVFSRFSFEAMRNVARRYQDFPKLNAPASLIFALGQNLPVLLFGVMFSPAVAGFYAMANRLSQAPISVVAHSMRRVFLQKAASISNRGGNLRRAFLLTTSGLALLGAIPFGVLWLAGEPLLQWLLGDRWAMAGRYLEIMAPWLLMLWVTAPSNPVFVVLRKQRVWLAVQLWLTITRLAVFGLGYGLSAGPEWTLQAFVIATVVGSLFTISMSLILISRHAMEVSAAAVAVDVRKYDDQ